MVFQLLEVPWKTINPPKLIPIITLKLCIDKSPSKVRFVAKMMSPALIPNHLKSSLGALGDPAGDPKVPQSSSKHLQARKKYLPACSKHPQYSKSEHTTTSHESHNASNHANIGLSSGAGGRGEAFIYSPHPLQGEHGVLDLLKNLQNLKLQAASAPAAGPCPKSPKIHLFSDFRKWQAQIEKKCSQ